ncbi:MAG TPA: hypothetical protein VGY76_01420 [Solirubrobacteraceae bacterium]|jgi:hypothetical protein|nr:hypothetical protein [Solirubrobacteraceae bacterium]
MAAPFIAYLTVFKSRLGIGNLVVNLTGFVHQPEAAVLRKLSAVLQERRAFAVDDSVAAPVFEYLLEKHLVGKSYRAKGRYAGYALEARGGKWTARDRAGDELTDMPVYLTDVWLADPAITSTIGVPTPDNAEEVLDFAFQLRLLSRSKNTWTAAAQLISGLRNESALESRAAENPFLLRLEAPALLRQVVASDGLVFREVVRGLCDERDDTMVRRDAVAARFMEAVKRAVAAAKILRVPPPDLRDLQAFLGLIENSSVSGGRRAARGGGQSIKKSAGPGVLEHRVSPRLEWLADLGYLTKDGIPKNSFEYRVTPQLRSLLADLDDGFGSDYWPETVATSQWRTNSAWASIRSTTSTRPWREAIARAYALMHRRIGPAPLREVTFALCLFASSDEAYSSVLQAAVKFASATEGAAVSGGRYRRSAENIYLPDPVWTDASR